MTPIKVFLDDTRDTPSGWVRTYTASETIELLKGGNVVELSLDHDLGDQTMCGDGHLVCVWVEEQVALHDFEPPRMVIHSANPVGRDRMQRAIESIERLRRREPPR